MRYNSISIAFLYYCTHCEDIKTTFLFLKEYGNVFYNLRILHTKRCSKKLEGDLKNIT